MPDLGLIKQGEQGARHRRGRFPRGSSDNRARRRGYRDHVCRAGRLLVAGESEAQIAKAIGLALAMIRKFARNLLQARYGCPVH